MFTLDYHHATKHHFHQFARSLGYLDWATQPSPFRSYAGAPLAELPRAVLAPDIPYDALFDRSAPPAAVDDASVADLLRCSLGLSAWKQAGASRWALRVNPSSGNLHPTEGYVIRDGRVAHYAPDVHALEERAALPRSAWDAFTAGQPGFLVALTSIHWREAWKYGERAFRYCQHDLGHAIAAFRLAAARLGWRLGLLPRWADAQLAAVLGIDRTAGYGDAEREQPGCVAVVTAGDIAPWMAADPDVLAAAARAAEWRGVANRLSASRVEWPIIDAVAKATEYPGLGPRDSGLGVRDSGCGTRDSGPGVRESMLPARNARGIILQRRSALAFDGRSTLPAAALMSMLRRLRPDATPFDALDFPPHVHLALFVHRVDGLTSGVYAYLRDAEVVAEWRAAMRPDFLWEEVDVGPAAGGRLFLLVPMDVTWPANRVSCDQDIAADGFFSLGMIARVESALRDRGEWFYRRLYWECGVIGQVLYLDAEAYAARATGIGCFYDDAVHEILGLRGGEWQSLYHFSMGVPVDDPRLSTEPGYEWEAADSGFSPRR